MLYRDSIQVQEVVNQMISQGYSVNAQDVDGNTALHWAAWFKLDALCQRLLEKGAKVDIGNSSGETAVHWAAKSSNVSALGKMIRNDHGLLSQRDVDGFTPFIVCAQNDNAPVMEWMYLKGISVEEQDDWGRTALQWACYKGHRRTVQWLLSRSANVVHRDHEGMSAIHWAALKGHEQIADALIDVGAVQLLGTADAAGDTPVTLAQRKKNRYLVCSFQKSRFLYWLIGRPQFSNNNFATLFVIFILYNIGVFIFILAPNVWSTRPDVVVMWGLLMAITIVLWTHCCWSDPGWLGIRTIRSQHNRFDHDGSGGFDAMQPVESQMLQAVEDDDWSDFATPELARLEVEQNKFNYQRQLITEARRRLDNPEYAGGTELQSLLHGMDLPVDTASNNVSNQNHLQRLCDRASFQLRERAKATGESLGRERVNALVAQDLEEYLHCVDRGEFKQVCVVCRTKREMRSHHCKECGRCVQRLDHHCPWIDNCVGIGNQRCFYCFIMTLLALIVSFYYLVWIYAVNAAIPAITGEDKNGLWTLMPWKFGNEVSQLILLATMAFNLIWVAFVGALVVRHSAYMMVNITTYEVLVRPTHVQRRFPKGNGKFWFLEDCGPLAAITNCVSYWTQDTSNDASDFLVSTPVDSFVAQPY